MFLFLDTETTGVAKNDRLCQLAYKTEKGEIVNQLSYKPPLIMVTVHPSRYSHNLIEKTNAFELQDKERHGTGNHTLFIGEVINSGVNSKGTPLCTLEYDGMYIGKQ